MSKRSEEQFDMIMGGVVLVWVGANVITLPLVPSPAYHLFANGVLVIAIGVVAILAGSGRA